MNQQLGLLLGSWSFLSIWLIAHWLLLDWEHWPSNFQTRLTRTTNTATAFPSSEFQLIQPASMFITAFSRTIDSVAGAPCFGWPFFWTPHIQLACRGVWARSEFRDTTAMTERLGRLFNNTMGRKVKFYPFAEAAIDSPLRQSAGLDCLLVQEPHVRLPVSPRRFLDM